MGEENNMSTHVFSITLPQINRVFKFCGMKYDRFTPVTSFFALNRFETNLKLAISIICQEFVDISVCTCNFTG